MCAKSNELMQRPEMIEEMAPGNQGSRLQTEKAVAEVMLPVYRLVERSLIAVTSASHFQSAFHIACHDFLRLVIFEDVPRAFGHADFFT